MAKRQLHKKFTNEQVKAILEKYASKEIRAKDAIGYLEVSRSHFYELVGKYHQDPDGFSIEYSRQKPTRRIDSAVEKNILKELKYEKVNLIDNPDVPTRWYNYSYIRQLLDDKYDQSVSVPTIINRAKKHGYWKAKPPKKTHDREVITNYPGELIQHDTSYHLWAPDSGVKWPLITSLDDYSRMLLHAKFLLKENSWQHIMALQKVCLTYGVPLAYYPDQHSIFRYVKDRDVHSPWKNYTKFTGDVLTQWEQVLGDCHIKSLHALSPQAKGKIERPYEWLQDHIVRTCAREGITEIEDANQVLEKEVKAYNTKKIHSTTKEVPIIRFNRAIKEGKSLFKEFKVNPPFQSFKDIFCLRITRTVDPYRYVSVKNFKLRVPKVPPREKVELRLYPNETTGLVEVRFWYENQFVSSQQVKLSDMPIIRF